MKNGKNMAFTYIGENPAKNNHAGNKARTDIDKILFERYGHPVCGFREEVFSSLGDKIKWVLTLENIKKLHRAFWAKGRNVVFAGNLGKSRLAKLCRERLPF